MVLCTLYTYDIKYMHVIGKCKHLFHTENDKNLLSKC